MSQPNQPNQVSQGNIQYVSQNQVKLFRKRTLANLSGKHINRKRPACFEYRSDADGLHGKPDDPASSAWRSNGAHCSPFKLPDKPSYSAAIHCTRFAFSNTKSITASPKDNQSLAARKQISLCQNRKCRHLLGTSNQTQFWRTMSWNCFIGLRRTLLKMSFQDHVRWLNIGAALL